MRPRALVVLNPRAGGSGASRAWTDLRALVARGVDVERVALLDPGGAWRAELAAAIARGVRVFIAAGGDGTVSAVAGAIATGRGDVALPSLTLGAIGLGSSNDFHKPAARVAGRIPLRIDPTTARPGSLARVRTTGLEGAIDVGFSLVSASIGVTASANARFNARGRALRALGRRWLDGAIAVAALSAIARHDDVACDLEIDGAPAPGPFASVAVARTRHVAGSLSYASPVDPAGDRFAVNVAQAMSRAEVLRTFVRLARGRFLGSPKTWHRAARVVEVRSTASFAIEIDGEVRRVASATFDVLEGGIALCTT